MEPITNKSVEEARDLTSFSFNSRITPTPVELPLSGLTSIHTLNQKLGFQLAVEPPRHASLYDIDGVLTSPFTKKLDPLLLKDISEQLIAGEYLAFNTGRSPSWVLDEVVAPLIKELGPEHQDCLERLFIAAEKGAVWISYGVNGGLKAAYESELLVDLSVSQVVQSHLLTVENPRLRIDYSKETMLSVEFFPEVGKEPAAEFEIFLKQREELEKVISSHLNATGLDATFRIDLTQIALDVENVRAGKDLGAERILKWLTSKDIAPDHVTTYGDSKSDIAMAAHLHAAGISVQHVHVGKETDLAEGSGLQIYISSKRFNEGTLEHRGLLKSCLEYPESNRKLLKSFEVAGGLVAGVAEWYDKVFLTAEKIEIDHEARRVRVHINGEASPVALDDRHRVGNAAIIREVSSLRPEVSDDGMTTVIGGAGEQILFSGGAVPVLTDSGEPELIMVQRGLKAPVAPGQLQTAAGRCDRTAGKSSYQELAEEYLFTGTQNGERVLIAVQNEFMNEHELSSIVRQALKNTLHEMDCRIGRLHAGDFSDVETADDLSETGVAGEIAKLRNKIKELQTVNKIVFLKAEEANPESTYRGYTVETCLDGKTLESAPDMHVYYQPDSNTFEMRAILHLDFSAVGVNQIEVFDGDGFGRNIKRMTVSQIATGELPVHRATEQFLSDYFSA